MHRFLFLWAGLSLFGSVAYAQDSGNDILVTGRYQATLATITPVAPGQARLEMTPVYQVGMDAPPPDAGSSLSKGSDLSGKGTVYIARAGRKAMLAGRVVCWRIQSVGQACGSLDGNRTAAVLNVGNRRNQMIVAYPVMLDHEGGQQIAFVAHPQNTQYQLRCTRTGQEDTQTFLFVDEQGVIRMPTAAQVERYMADHQSYC